MGQKVWLITGVSKGLGKELSKQILDAGDIVIGTVRNEEDQQTFDNNVNAKSFIIDLTKTDHIDSLINEVIEQYGQIDVLVNNAGFGVFGMIEEFEEQEIIRQFNVNFMSVWKLCQAVIPYMRNKGQGVIVQLSSRVGITAGIGNGIYAASKFALEGMSESLEQEVKPFGIKVLLVEPGALRTDFFGESVYYARNKFPLYAEKLGDIRINTKKINGNQPGNPVAAAQAIIRAVNNDVPTFRLPLTAGTIETMKAKIADLQNCIALTEEIAVSVDY
ncbi:SDR family NAD(P)-dependent oxidoreductase (plasmid) [Chryseobacterium panacisoli]|uniref:SDR family NAD(P)-dependent oxidoreductase n=1 Tax=Chryseobacterium panacisoli TaxID=1807141 RepID=A0A5D8ZUV1_9FLAO|nr:SDR family NAD(P)-dependent oxidoreductase [Chryseobacterium panacisoli]TZF98668.1 SDR family NAD(P)-dependent oxidoreductase [Chryseobacterium panacisoli]